MPEDKNDQNDQNLRKPSTLAEKVSDLIKKAEDGLLSEEDIVNPDEGRYRDIEIEQKIAAQKAAEAALAKAEEELMSIEQEEQELVDSVRGKKQNKEKTRKQSIIESKSKREKIQQVTQALQQKREQKRALMQSIKASRDNLMKLGKPATEKMRAYQMHAQRAPGVQPGVKNPEIDPASKKRGVQHDTELGSELRVERFETVVDGVKVEGTVTSRVDDNKKTGKMEMVSEPDIKVDKVDNVAASLGSIKPDAILKSLPRDTGGIGKG